LISRYEELRRQALGQSGALPRGQGLVLLMQRGMRAWMQAWALCSVAPPAPSPPQPQGEPEIFPLEMHKEVAMLLAGMVLSRPQEAIA
jgi:hypothetical protein